LPGKFFYLAGNLPEVFLHFLDLGFHVFFVVPQKVTALFQGVIPFHAQFHKIFDLLNGHAGIFQAADEAQPFEVVFRIPAYAAPAPAHAGEEALMFIIPKHMGGQGCFFRNLLNGISQKILLFSFRLLT
jgi:hypothetical protein